VNRDFDLIVFDWDGTLVDSADHIARSLQLACEDLDLLQPTDAQARYVIGLGFEDAVKYLAPDLPVHRYSELVEHYRIHYTERAELVSLFPRVAEGLPALKQRGYLVAVATGKTRGGLERSLEQTGVGRYTDATRCADEGLAKPNPDMLNWLMRELVVEPGRTLMVGDTTHDLQMASNAGVNAVAVTYGAHTRDMLEAHRPLKCIDRFEELLRWAGV
jgi:phosphoglycolate phosphatase